MGRRFYRSGQFARKVSVSVRTLRYYDRVGLLSPSQHTESGYRLYTDEDMVRLQQILALKFLGFSLEEIAVCLRTGPRRLGEVLATQKAMMFEKRGQLDRIIQALEETERVVAAGCSGWDSIVHVMEVIHMQQKNDWPSKYFTAEQRQTMDQLSTTSYSEEALRGLAARGPWTEEDQKRVDGQYAWIAAELTRLVAAGAEPASPEAQAVAALQRELIAQFTQGDPGIEAGLRNWWQSYQALPEEQKPPVMAQRSKEEEELLQKALEIYDQRQKETQTS